MLPLIAVGLRIVRLHPLLTTLRWLADRTGRCSQAPDLAAEVRRTRRFTALAAERGPLAGTCLSRSLTLWWLLRRRGIRTDLRIGVRKEAGRFEAHAWVEREGVVVNDRTEVVQQYAAFAETLSA